MIKKIVSYSLLLCLFIAIPLAIMGYTKVDLGKPFLALMKTASIQTEQYKVEIPSIPRIPLFDAESLKWYENILNFLIKLVNGLSTLINVLISLLNVVIELLEFIFFLVRDLIQFKDDLQLYGTQRVM